MALPLRRKDPALSDPPLSATLRDEPYRFGFFQAVRLLERLFPAKGPVGRDLPPDQEAVRFHAHLSMVFPPSEVFDLSLDAQGETAHMTVAFLGLTGPSGALPRHYTELLLERVRQKDYALRDFFDLFNHRLLSLFYRAWEKNRFWTGFERAELEGRRLLAKDPRKHRGYVLEGRARRDVFSQSLLDLAGLGAGALRYRMSVSDRLEGRMAIDDETLRYYGGLLANQHRSASALEGLLADYFGLEVSVEQFRGQWLYLEPENQTSLVEGGNVQLGRNVVVGERFWDVQGRFRVRLGPLGYREFCDFLPCGTAFRPLAHLARLFAGQQFDIDVQVVLRAAEVPWCTLGSSSPDGARLGWNTWIRNQELTHDALDAVFTVQDN
jgi:type VI secretion system protein ImpH